MGYAGKEYAIDLGRGGLVGTPNIEGLPDYAMVWPSQNLNLRYGFRGTRGGTAKIYTNPIVGAKKNITGLYDFTLRDGTQFLVASTGDGILYKNNLDAIKSSLSGSNFFSFETGENKLFVADGASTPQVWTGTGNTADIAKPPSDWTMSKPFQFCLHKVMNAQRMAAATTTNVYLSKGYAAAGDLEDFQDGSVQNLPVDTADGYGIQAIIDHNGQLWVFGKRNSFRLDDSDATASNWRLVSNAFVGGVASFRLVCRTPNNDMVAMMEDGTIYSINAVQQYGDYKAASLTIPARMDKWIRDYIDLSKINLFHMVYDPSIRAIRIFMVKTGSSTPDTCLCYFIDRAPEEAWMVHNNYAYTSGLKADVSCVFRKSAGVYKVYTGDTNGYKWELESSAKSDDGNPYTTSFRTPHMSMGQARQQKSYRRAKILLVSAGTGTLNARATIDGVSCAVASGLTIGTSGRTLGSFVLGTDALEGSSVGEVAFDIGDVGRRIQLELFTSTVLDDKEMSQIIIDAKPLGVQP